MALKNVSSLMYSEPFIKEFLCNITIIVVMVVVVVVSAAAAAAAAVVVVQLT
jgi:hypothetical protein